MFLTLFLCCRSNSKFPGRHSVFIRGQDRSSFSYRCGGNGGCCPSSTVRVYVGSDCGEKPLYHPFEEIKESDGWRDGEEGDGPSGHARISDAVLTRTLVEVR